MTVVRLPEIFQDGMVLQRRKPICVWGTAENCEWVTVSLENHQAGAPVENGHWQVYLPPMEAALDLQMRIQAVETEIVLSRIAVGEVWIAAGQSNMAFTIGDDRKREWACRQVRSEIRCFEVRKQAYQGQERDFGEIGGGVWREAGPRDIPTFSAVGFYFACELYGRMQVPIGIVNCTWGGTSAACWIPRSRFTGRLHHILEEMDQVQREVDWKQMREAYVQWYRRILEIPIDLSREITQPMKTAAPPTEGPLRFSQLILSPYSPNRPCGLFETMVQTIAPYSIKGVLWYQGESDADRPGDYEELLKGVIGAWRERWREELPFLLVLLAGFERMTVPMDFVPIRDAQIRVSHTVPGVSIASAMDLGSRYDIHPKQKQPVGLRLAELALEKVYGWNIEAQSPRIRELSLQSDQVVIRFQHCGSGMTCCGREPRTFDILVDDRAVEPQEILVEPWEIRIRCRAFTRGGQIRISYARRSYCEANIYNSEGLPLLPFQAVIKSDCEETEVHENTR